MTDRLSPEAAGNVLAANIVNATAPARRSLWEPVNEPMGLGDYIAAALIAVVAVPAFWLLWAVTP